MNEIKIYQLNILTALIYYYREPVSIVDYAIQAS